MSFRPSADDERDSRDSSDLGIALKVHLQTLDSISDSFQAGNFEMLDIFPTPDGS